MGLGQEIIVRSYLHMPSDKSRLMLIVIMFRSRSKVLWLLEQVYIWWIHSAGSPVCKADRRSLVCACTFKSCVLSGGAPCNTDWHINVSICGIVSAHKLTVKLKAMGTWERAFVRIKMGGAVE